MISFNKISKQYGRQVLFVDASFQLNPGEKVGPGRAQRRRQDDAVPDDRGRRGARRGGRLGPEEADDRLLPAGRRRDVRPVGDRRGDRGQRTGGRSAPRARGAAARDGGSCESGRHGSHPRPLRRGAGGIRASRRLRAREPGARGAARPRVRRRRGSTATSARCRAAGRCAWRWPACCSGGPTSC